MCGWIGNGILARDPIRPNRAWNALGVIGPSRSVIRTAPVRAADVAARVSRRPASARKRTWSDDLCLVVCLASCWHIAVNSVGGSPKQDPAHAPGIEKRTRAPEVPHGTSGTT